MKNRNSRHILKPFINERLGDDYHLTVSNIINIDLDKLRVRLIARQSDSFSAYRKLLPLLLWTTK